MKTISYTDYSPSNLSGEAIRAEKSDEAPNIFRYVGASPFEVPQHVDVLVLPKDRLVFQFLYANDEPVDEELSQLSIDGAVKARLAKHTRKISELHIDQASQRLFGPLNLDRIYFLRMLTNQTPEVSKASVRNFELVSTLLAGIGPGFRKQLADLLRKPEEPSASSASETKE